MKIIKGEFNSTLINRTGGFSRTDVLVILAVILGLAFLLVKTVGQQSDSVKSTNCLENLKQISTALAAYSNDSNQKLPFASMQPRPGTPTTWDMLIATSLRVELRGDQLDMPPPPYGRLLKCPEDTISAAAIQQVNIPARRSYAMPAHRMNRPNWPPSEYNATGVGLGWSQNRKKGNASYAYLESVSTLPAISMDMITEPDKTILITEQAQADNYIGKSKRATIKSTLEHVDSTVLPSGSYHGGRINYLMVDGHVENLKPEETVGPEGEVSDAADTHFGMWTILSGD
ncbi:MAG: prepilin-type processing-associated H-X9-DG protein [Candidatus Binatia bacterium]|jgi:prepilin-type processing-associated H-X9-DG protein